MSGGWDGLHGNSLTRTPSHGSGGGGDGGFLPPDNLTEEFEGSNGGDITISSDMSLSLMLYQVCSWYTKSLATRPLITRMATSALLGALGDWLCQRLESKTTVFSCNYRRLLVFSLVNGLFLATVIHKWFQFLAGMPILKGLNALQQALLMVEISPPSFTHTSTSSSPSTSSHFLQVSIDQTIGAVGTTIGLIFAFEFINRCIPPFEKKFITFPSDAVAAVKDRLGPILLANWTCWPLIQFLNFLLVPEIYRVLVVSLFQLVWNVFLSKILNTGSTDISADITEPILVQPPEMYDVLEGMAGGSHPPSLTSLTCTHHTATIPPADLEQSQDM